MNGACKCVHRRGCDSFCCLRTAVNVPVFGRLQRRDCLKFAGALKVLMTAHEFCICGFGIVLGCLVEMLGRTQDVAIKMTYPWRSFAKQLTNI